MSIPRKRSVSCPNCGETIEYTMWLSINTEKDFAISDIISGKLFEAECTKCGITIHMDYPILFNDMLHHMMIYYTFPEKAHEVERSAFTSRVPGTQYRIVTSQDALREKAAILNDGLDDRFVELLKALVLPQLQKQLQEKQIKSILYLDKDDAYHFELLYDGGNSVATIPAEYYDHVRETYGPLPDDNDTPFYIDREWAEGILAGEH